jgi:hypothetical protein
MQPARALLGFSGVALSIEVELNAFQEVLERLPVVRVPNESVVEWFDIAGRLSRYGSARQPPAPLGGSFRFVPGRIQVHKVLSSQRVSSSRQQAICCLCGAIIGPTASPGGQGVIALPSFHLPVIPFAGNRSSNLNKTRVRMWIDSSRDENREVGKRAPCNRDKCVKEGRRSLLRRDAGYLNLSNVRAAARSARQPLEIDPVRARSDTAAAAACRSPLENKRLESRRDVMVVCPGR